jgi:hypothetical protein
MKRKSRIKKSRTLADIRHIPKWARKKLGFTCEEVEFSYKLLKYFIGDSKEVDSMSVRSTSCIPEIGRNAVTEWQE